MAVDINEDGYATQSPKEGHDCGIEIDFETLGEEYRENGTPAMTPELDRKITKIQAEIEKMAPNMKALENLNDVKAKLAATDKEVVNARNRSKDAREELGRSGAHMLYSEARLKSDILSARSDRFNKAFTRISKRISKFYKHLTKGKHSPMGGVA